MKLTRVLGKTLVKDYKHFKMFNYHIKLPTGIETDFIMRESGEYAVIIPVLKNEKIIMVKQHRLGANEVSIEFPMGNVKGLDPTNMAKTELKEETGYVAQKMRKIFSFYISPGWSNQKGHLFVAEGLKKGERELEQYEYIENIILSKTEIEQKIKAGKIFDMTTIGCYYRYKEFLNSLNGPFG